MGKKSGFFFSLANRQNISCIIERKYALLRYGVLVHFLRHNFKLSLNEYSLFALWYQGLVQSLMLTLPIVYKAIYFSSLIFMRRETFEGYLLESECVIEQPQCRRHFFYWQNGETGKHSICIGVGTVLIWAIVTFPNPTSQDGFLDDWTISFHENVQWMFLIDRVVVFNRKISACQEISTFWFATIAKVIRTCPFLIAIMECKSVFQSNVQVLDLLRIVEVSVAGTRKGNCHSRGQYLDIATLEADQRIAWKINRNLLVVFKELLTNILKSVNRTFL